MVRLCLVGETESVWRAGGEGKRVSEVLVISNNDELHTGVFVMLLTQYRFCVSAHL